MAENEGENHDLLQTWNQYDSELVIGLVGAVGTDLKRVADLLREQIRQVGYEVEIVHISKDVIPRICDVNVDENDEFQRIWDLMTAGNEARKAAGSDAALAIGAAAIISAERSKNADGFPIPQPKTAYIISSLKRPEEVERLRRIYRQGFVLIGIAGDEDWRFDQLTQRQGISKDNALKLIERDANETKENHGQRLDKTFPLSDFFINPAGEGGRLQCELRRIVQLLFGHPEITPSFDEHAMFMAFASALRSGDLSRQVGAVIAKNEQVIAMGANDCPKFGGGLYWPMPDETGCLGNVEDGRDFTRGFDSNRREQEEIISRIVSAGVKSGLNAETLRSVLENSSISDLTEFGRVVHAEMDALLSCARSNISVQDAILYTTTFPCHNCAKHIVAAGIARVVYIEPYEKSKAPKFHHDSIEVGLERKLKDRVLFQPFFGVGPRRFFDLFSMHLSSGYPLKRKAEDNCQRFEWDSKKARLRLDMLPRTYIDHELDAVDMFGKFLEKARGGNVIE